MDITALIMAGGKGTRMGLTVEKPMLSFLGKPMIDYVIAAVGQAKNITDINKLVFLDKSSINLAYDKVVWMR